MELPTFLTTEMDNNLLFSTMATSSTVFIIVMSAFAIHRVSTINQDKLNKKHEIVALELENSKLELDNERKQEIIDNNIISVGNIITEEQQKKYRKYAKLIMDNNAKIAEKKQIIEENEEFLKRYENTDIYLNKSIHYLYIFSSLYIVIPIVLLSLPNPTKMMIFLNFVKFVLLATMIIFILKIIKDCKENLLLSDSLNKKVD